MIGYIIVVIINSSCACHCDDDGMLRPDSLDERKRGCIVQLRVPTKFKQDQVGRCAHPLKQRLVQASQRLRLEGKGSNWRVKEPGPEQLFPGPAQLPPGQERPPLGPDQLLLGSEQPLPTPEQLLPNNY